MNYSIVTIGYKSLENIKRCVEEAYSSTIPPSEFVVVINPYVYNQQTQSIVDYVCNEKRITRFAYMSQNIGCAKAFNLGFSLCLGDKIVALSDDCRVGPTTYEKMLSAFCHDKVGIVGVEGGLPIKNFVPAKGFLLMFNKKMIEEVRGYDEEASPLADETELALRAKTFGWESVIAKDCQWYHVHDVSIHVHQPINYMGMQITPESISNSFCQSMTNKKNNWISKI